MSSDLHVPPQMVPPTSEGRAPVTARPHRSSAARLALVLGVGFMVLAVLYGALVVLSLLLHRSDVRTTALPDVPARLVVTVNGDVRVDAAPPGGGSSMTVRRQWTWAAPDVRTSRVGDQLRVQSSCPQIGPLSCTTAVRLTVPAGTSVTVRSSHGAVRAFGLRADADLGTDAGSVQATDISAAHLRMYSDAGSVRGDRLAVPDVDAGSDAGSVRLDLAVEPTRVVADSDAGSVRVAVPAGPSGYRVDARTSAGRRTVGVRLDDGSDRLLRATSDAGAVTITYR